jgi:hypothetical protein
MKSSSSSSYFFIEDCAVAQAVSGWLPSRQPGFKSSSGHVGFVAEETTQVRFSPSTAVSPAILVQWGK